MSTVNHKLAEPIQAHNEEVKELTVRRPTVQECRAIKSLPYTIGESGYPILDVEVAAKYIAICAAIPSSSVNQLGLPDLNAIAWLIVGFFMPRDLDQSQA